MSYSLPPFWEHFEFDQNEVETCVSETSGSYKGLTHQALYTSEFDLLEIFSHPDIKGTFCDLGCGTGKAPLLYGYLFKGCKAIGLEFEEARLNVGRKFKRLYPAANVSLIHADLLTCNLPRADVYFLYFPTGPVLDRILTKLYESKIVFQLVVIESHGDLLPRLDLENWLTLKAEIPLRSQRHYPSARIYLRNNEVRSNSLLPFTLSFQKKFLLISEEEWIGETEGMEWTQNKSFTLIYPPRTMQWKDVKKLMVLEDIDLSMHAAIFIRRMGVVEVHTLKKIFEGIIRKIITKPTFHLELSSGEKVEWDEILTITQDNKICYESLRRS
jgi:SAM-dependent methyltransferase